MHECDYNQCYTYKRNTSLQQINASLSNMMVVTKRINYNKLMLKCVLYIWWFSNNWSLKLVVKYAFSMLFSLLMKVINIYLVNLD